MKGTGSSDKKNWKQSFCMLPFCTVIVKSVAKLHKSKTALLILILKIGPVLFIFWRVLSDLQEIVVLAKNREEQPFFLIYCSLDIQMGSYRATARKAAFPLSYRIL